MKTPVSMSDITEYFILITAVLLHCPIAHPAQEVSTVRSNYTV